MLAINSANLLTLSNLEDQYGNTISDATVAVSLQTLAGSEVLTAELDADGDGAYSTVLEAEDVADLVEGTRYRFVMTVTSETGQLVKRWTEVAKYQGA